VSFDFSLILIYWRQLLAGLSLTVALSISVLILSTVIGFVIALARESNSRVLQVPATWYVNIFRMLPLLVVLYFSFYALPQVAFTLSPLEAAILGLTLASGAYLSEDIRGGLRGVDAGQWQAARALGLPYMHTLRRIIMPQALRIMVGPYISRSIIIVKGTSAAGIVAVSELTGVTYGLISRTYHAFEFLTVAAVGYLALNGLLAALQAWAEFRLRAQ
jgi:His/Glu/Gln/Arg/opine family amino acid ABC transporter permease subunit